MRKLILGLALALAPTLAHATTMQVEQHEGTTRLVIDGEINVGDGDRFLERVAIVRPTELEMNSPGGDVDSGMVIARWVHENRQIKVVVEDYCNSACSYAALVALGRGDLMVNASSSVGVHQVMRCLRRPTGQGECGMDQAGSRHTAWLRRTGRAARRNGGDAAQRYCRLQCRRSGKDGGDCRADRAARFAAGSANLPKFPAGSPATGRDCACRRRHARHSHSPPLRPDAGFSPSGSCNQQGTHDEVQQANAPRPGARLEVNYTTLKVAYVIEIGIIFARLSMPAMSSPTVTSPTSGSCGSWPSSADSPSRWPRSARIQLAKTIAHAERLADEGAGCRRRRLHVRRDDQVDGAGDGPDLFCHGFGRCSRRRTRGSVPRTILTRSSPIATPPPRSFEQLEKDVADAETNIQRINDRIAQQGSAPVDRVLKVPVKSTCRGKRGKSYSCTKTITKYEKVAWAGQQFADQLPAANDKRAEAVAKRDMQQAEVLNLEQQKAAQVAVVGEAESAERDAVGNSQLHSFTAMVYGKDPVEVTDLKGRGLGRHLMGAVAERVLRSNSAGRLHLWAFEQNLVARRFYERLGGIITGRHVEVAPDGSEVNALRYCWSDLSGLAGIC